MKKVFQTVVMISLIIFTYGCSHVVNSVKMVTPNDFSKNESMSYTLNSDLDLFANINVCTTRFELNTNEDDKIQVKIYYSDQNVRDKLNFSFENDNLSITKTGQSSSNCSQNKALDSYIIISLPYQMNIINIHLNAYSSFANFTDLTVSQLAYDQINGNISLRNTDANRITLSNENGNLNLQDVTTVSAELKVNNGNITINTGEITDRISMDVSNGNINIKHMNSQELMVSTINGNVDLETASITASVELNSINGNITCTNVNEENKPTDLVASINVETTNGNVNLQNVYFQSVNLQTTNGNLTYYNQDKDFQVINAKYHITNGTIDFDINGNIIKY